MNKWNNKFRYRVASCWLFILSYRTAYKILVGQPDRNGPLGKHLSDDDNNDIKISEVGGVD